MSKRRAPKKHSNSFLTRELVTLQHKFNMLLHATVEIESQRQLAMHWGKRFVDSAVASCDDNLEYNLGLHGLD